MNELEKRRMEKEQAKQRKMMEDKKFLQEQDAYLAKRDNERNQVG